ncbi:cell division protein CrgA [Dermabacteraceae bacterium P13115]
MHARVLARAKAVKAMKEPRVDRRRKAKEGNPAWLVPTMCTLLVLSLVYLVVFYVSTGAYPLPIGSWNLAVGFTLLFAGGALATRWK